MDACFTPNDDKIISVDHKGFMIISDTSTGNHSTEIIRGYKNSIYYICHSPIKD